MRTIELPRESFRDLVAVVDSIPLAEIKTIKEIRLTHNLVKDLSNAVKEYTEARMENSKKQVDIAKKYQEQYQAETKGMPEEEKNAAGNRINGELKAELDKELGEEIKSLAAQGKEMASLELGEDKFDQLKALFEKHGPAKYLKREAFVEVADALGLE